MSDQTRAKYRIFCPDSEVDTLPLGVFVEERYPAFIIVSANADAIHEVRQRYPVEALAVPKPPPALPAVAGIAAAASEPATRGPYTMVARFRAPVRPEWMQEIEESGCELLGPIGSSTVVVTCPNKGALAKLRDNPDIERITDYVPDIQLAPEVVEALEAALDSATVAGAAADAANAPPPTRSRSDVAVPGVVVASFFTREQQQLALRSFRRQGIREIYEAGDTDLLVSLAESDDPIGDVLVIASRPGLRSLSEQKLSKLFNDVARRIIAEHVVQPKPQGLGLSGHGEIVAVADTGLDTGDAATIHHDFKGRILDIQSFPIVPSLSLFVHNPGGDDGPADRFSGHGTHVCGSVLGNGAKSASIEPTPIRGTAPEAKLVFQAIEQAPTWNKKGRLSWLLLHRSEPPVSGLFGIPDDLQELFQAAYDRGARIHSNSWGGGGAGDYDSQCAALDRFVWEHKDFLVIFAAGNDGKDTISPGSGIDATTVTPPGTAKNCLTVGASENHRPGLCVDTYGGWWPKDFRLGPFGSDPMTDSADDIAAFSSRGPCGNGRRKPDVVAPGTFILSTRSSQIPGNNFAWGAFPPAKTHYMYMGGTSMATPLVAGCAALVRQYLREREGIETPSAALLKAALIHSAQYIRYRYARPDSAPWADNEQGWGRVNLDQVLNPPAPARVIFVDATDGVSANDKRQFEIEITDAAIPLRITMVYTDFPGKDLINNLNLFAFNPQGRYFVGNEFSGSDAPDNSNNVEGIVVQNPAPGRWRIEVVASNVPQGPQDFALVVSGAGATLT